MAGAGTRRSLAGAAGACPNLEEGNESAVEFSGRYGSDSYDIELLSRAEDFQGVMTFSGKLTGRRGGACPNTNQEGICVSNI